MFLGLVYFLLARYCENQKTTLVAKEPSSLEQTIDPCPTISHVYANWSSKQIITTETWANHLKELIDEMEESTKLRITGLYRNQEENLTAFENLGLARANSISQIIGLDEDKIQIAHDSLRNVNYSFDCPLPAVKLRLVTVSKKIKEIEDRTLIYFPVNSINKLADAEVEKYLDDVVLRVIGTGEKILLDGHTDNSGSTEYNLELGQRRANIIKQYLVSKNVRADKIITNSYGDQQPLASNDTEEGRAENRRTELRIINENIEK